MRDPTPSSALPLEADHPDIDALLQGDPKAFEALVRNESPRLYRVILRIVQDADEAQSVLQETFLQAYKRLSTFRKESKFTTWLYAIGINQARTARRKQRRLHLLEEDEIDRLQPQFEKGHYAARFEAWDPQRLTERKERQALVRQAIERLPEGYMVVITLRDLEERSTTEVAQLLGISNGAVRVRLHRARQALRALLDPHFRPTD